MRYTTARDDVCGGTSHVPLATGLGIRTSGFFPVVIVTTAGWLTTQLGGWCCSDFIRNYHVIRARDGMVGLSHCPHVEERIEEGGNKRANAGISCQIAQLSDSTTMKEYGKTQWLALLRLPRTPSLNLCLAREAWKPDPLRYRTWPAAVSSRFIARDWAATLPEAPHRSLWRTRSSRFVSSCLA